MFVRCVRALVRVARVLVLVCTVARRVCGPSTHQMRLLPKLLLLLLLPTWLLPIVPLVERSIVRNDPNRGASCFCPASSGLGVFSRKLITSGARFSSVLVVFVVVVAAAVLDELSLPLRLWLGLSVTAGITALRASVSRSSCSICCC